MAASRVMHDKAVGFSASIAILGLIAGNFPTSLVPVSVDNILTRQPVFLTDKVANTD
jgi:hypothetical protein